MLGGGALQGQLIRGRALGRTVEDALTAAASASRDDHGDAVGAAHRGDLKPSS